MERIPLVYIVDDEEDFNKLLVLVLKKYGIKCESFKTSQDLLAKVKTHPPDLCIVDLNLGPRERGYDLISALRTSGNKLLPIIICSGENDRQVISHALEMGANDYLLKPLDRGVLTAKLLQFIKTTELDFSQASAPSATLQTEIDTSLELAMKLTSVEEDGLTLVSNHLILKGSVVTLSGEMIQEISKRGKPLMATVISSELLPGDESYTIYLEFDATDKGLLENTRAWLSKRWTPPSSSSDSSGDDIYPS